MYAKLKSDRNLAYSLIQLIQLTHSLAGGSMQNRNRHENFSNKYEKFMYMLLRLYSTATISITALLRLSWYIKCRTWVSNMFELVIYVNEARNGKPYFWARDFSNFQNINDSTCFASFQHLSNIMGLGGINKPNITYSNTSWLFVFHEIHAYVEVALFMCIEREYMISIDDSVNSQEFCGFCELLCILLLQIIKFTGMIG